MKTKHILKIFLAIMITSFFTATCFADQQMVWVPGHWYSGVFIPGQYVPFTTPSAAVKNHTTKNDLATSKYEWNGSGGWRR